MTDTSTTLTINVHTTPAAIFDTLARVFPVAARNEARWVTLNHDGVLVTFFAEQAPQTPQAPAEPVA